MTDEEPLLDWLRERGLVSAADVRLTPLSGGVSSDIWLVDNGRSRFVVKRARAKLRVAGDWFADVSRNRFEQEFLEYVGKFLPEAVPRVLAADRRHGWFAMEYLGPEFANWKDLLLAGHADAAQAERAARVLAAIHGRSWDDAEARKRFATLANFHDLRIDPYLLTTGWKHPDLRPHFEAEAARLAASAMCLVHGDFSPKNMLISRDRLVLLDCEVAWFGDPAFDLAFLINHLFLKALYHAENPGPFLDLATHFQDTYFAAVPGEFQDGLEARACRLVPMLMLARVDGKSPVEYLADERKRALVRTFVAQRLSDKCGSLRHMAGLWRERIEGLR
jgi:aminoglycoside phosphotransferase (APT) family kinase protein